MKNVTKKVEMAKAKKVDAIAQTKQILANIKKAEIKEKVIVTPKTTITKTQDNATLKVVKESKRDNVVREKNYIYVESIDSCNFPGKVF